MQTAFGKVILLGEHAVVYGVPAIACGIDRGARARATPAERARVRLAGAEHAAGDGSDLGRALEALLADLGARPHELELESELPPGAGLGSSAALGVAAARAVLAASGRAEDPAVVQRAALAWESVFHGSPSGIDTAAAALGGCLWFVRGEGASRIRLSRPLTLAIALAGPPASTKLMVESVARLRARRPEPFEKTLDGIRSLVENAKLALEAGDVQGLGGLLDLNQMLLSGLMVSTAELERTCRLARSAGALGAKLTGAGGGGAVVALCERDATAVLEAWRAEGLECFPAVVGKGAEP